MSINSSVTTQSVDGSSPEVVDWTDLGRKMWSFLTGREAAINYTFVDMSVEVPRDTGPTPPAPPGSSTEPSRSPPATTPPARPDRWPSPCRSAPTSTSR